jgi:serine/threonine protein kinase
VGVPPAAVFDDTYSLLGGTPIAKGGFSSVWRCRLRPSESSKALKSFELERAVKRIDKCKIPHRGRRFLFGQGSSVGEIQLHLSVHHPNIVELIDVFDDAGVVSLVMEYCQGGDLLEIILSRKASSSCGSSGLPEAAAATAVQHLLSALSFLHEKGIVHRDVKCENLFQLEAKGTCPTELATFKLGDLGLAAKVAPDEVLLEQVGSPSTSAPEVVQGWPYAKPVDIWSAGVTLYTALAGRRPFEASTYAQMLVNASKAHDLVLCGSPWETLTAGARELAGLLLQPKALRRPSAAEALQHPWLQRF